MTTVRPSYLLQLQTIQKLYNDVSQGSMVDLPQEVRIYSQIAKKKKIIWCDEKYNIYHGSVEDITLGIKISVIYEQ